ncbi:MAG: hypothetical protein NTX51_18390, partial [Verrucomicrobia bacterium]|nr:hypothetical protein [Verrucomicrobiota bacterium]
SFELILSELNREAFSTILNADQADLFWAPRSVGSSLQANVPHPRPRLKFAALQEWFFVWPAESSKTQN